MARESRGFLKGSERPEAGCLGELAESTQEMLETWPSGPEAYVHVRRFQLGGGGGVP